MTVDELLDQQAVRDVLIRYTRGIDRMDPDLVRSCYHPDAYDDHGAFQGGTEEFVAWFQQALSFFERTMHFVGNQLVEVDGDIAHAESYCVAYHRRAATRRRGRASTSASGCATSTGSSGATANGASRTGVASSTGAGVDTITGEWESSAAEALRGRRATRQRPCLPLTERPEERPDVVDEQVGHLHRGEVAAAWRLGPVDDV